MLEKLDIDPTQSVATNHCIINKINELCDVVNALVEENNIHEKQIDELQMKEPSDPYTEQRKWIGKVCRFRDEHFEPDCWDYGVLEEIDDKDPVTGSNFRSSDGYWYDFCEPVKPDDSIIYQGE